MMRYVYILKLSNGDCYVGKTDDLERRLKEHTSGYNKTTSRFLPVKLVTYCAFDTLEKADRFEMYLKSGSGIAFRAKHLV